MLPGVTLTKLVSPTRLCICERRVLAVHAQALHKILHCIVISCQAKHVIATSCELCRGE